MLFRALLTVASLVGQEYVVHGRHVRAVAVHSCCLAHSTAIVSSLHSCGALDICTEDEVKSVADGIVSQGLDKLGYQWITVSFLHSQTA